MNRYHLREIADAIRCVDGSTELINASDFPDRIKNLNNYVLNIDDIYRYCIQRDTGRINNILNINDVINGLPLSCIRDHAFHQWSDITLTSLPAGVTSIGKYAFAGCYNLALTSLPEGLTSIGENAFDNCYNMSLTSLPEGITTIEPYTFFCCRNITLTSLPSNLTSIGSFAFFGCNLIVHMVFPTNITNIGFDSFASCSYLENVTLGAYMHPVDNVSISPYAFASCDNLISMTIYTVGGLPLSDAPYGATNATVTYIDSNIG